jgi:hypothetical protein
VDLSDARICGGRNGETAFEVGVYGRGGKLGGQGVGVLCLCAVFACVVDEFVDGGLGAMRVVAVIVSPDFTGANVGDYLHIHV